MSDTQNSNKENTPANSPFYIVGIGASAGGVQALKEFFENVPPLSGMAYVVILHLSPDHDSQLTQLLQTVTDMTVVQVTEKVKVQPNHVYVIPPNQHLMMEDSFITVSVNTAVEERRAPVDIFFRTLAESHRTQAVAVVLSGTGANGSMGLKRVKEKGGAVFVQNPREAEFSEMPRNSIATEMVDEVLPVADIPAKIIAYQQSQSISRIPLETIHQPQDQQQALREIFTQLRLRTGHDFTNYKRPTLLRRIERRINLHDLPDLPAYVAYILQHPDEINSLLKDLLISVTNFFRDKRAFEELEKEVLPLIFQGKNSADQVRIWIAGCATGEEAYSLAILCAERTAHILDSPKVQLFATDIDEAAIAAARDGLYTLNDAADVSPERLRRFFTKEGDSYRIRREIREMVLFASHNFLKDPPFSHLHLITCRNVLIYLNHTAQERVMETFHFALNPGGHLFLGTSESADSATDLYSTFSREHHIFQSRQATNRAYPVPESVPSFRAYEPLPITPTTPELPTRTLERITYGDLHQRLLEEYAPPSIVINEEYDIVHLSERAGRFLQIGGGELSRNLLKLVRQDMRLELRSALYQSVQRQAPVEIRGLQMTINEGSEKLNIQVRPVLREGDSARGFILVIFSPAEPGTEENIVYSSEEPMARHLEEELMRLKAQLRSSNEQHEFQAEELKAANEELQAMNEELRSAAEELETSKEELQSINEELTTVNQELKVKVDEVSMAGNNLQNLINSTDLGTIFLDRSFRVVLFTPSTRNLFNLIPADYGRPLSDITSKLLYDKIIDDAELVLERLQAIEQEVRSIDDHTYLMRILPYRTVEDHIQGVVITFINITERIKAEEELRQAEEKYLFQLEEEVVVRTAELKESQHQYESLVENTPDIIIRWDKNLRLVFANSAFESKMGWASQQGLGKTKREIGQPAAVAQAYMDSLQTVFATGEATEHFNTLSTWQGEFQLYTRMVPEKNDQGEVQTVLTIARDITDIRKAEQEIIQLKDEVAQRATDKYESLFNSMDEGVSTLQLIFNEAEKVVDFIYLEQNPAMTRQTGFSADITGKKVSQVIPNLEPFWFETYERVFKSGEPERHQNYILAIDRWFDIYISRVGEKSSGQIACVYNNITERKNAERKQTFLLKLSDAIRPLTDPIAIQQTAMQVIGEHLGAHRAFYGDMQEDEDTLILGPGYANTVSLLEGYIKFSEFDSNLVDAYRQGQTVVINDIAIDHKKSDQNQAAMESIQMLAAVGVPLLKDGKVKGILSIHQSHPRKWTAAEISLIEETAERTWAAVERAKVEVALRKSKERYRTLFNSIDEGFSLLDIQFDENGAAYDVIIRDANPAQERIDGVKAQIGMRVKELLPNIEMTWIERYAAVARSGQSIEFTDWSEATQRWYQVRASRLGGEGSTLVVAVYNDITDRQKAEQVISDSEKRKSFLLQLSDTLAPLSNAAAIQATVAHSLMDYLAANRCYYGEIDGNRINIQRDARQPGLSSVAGVYDLNTMPDVKPFLLSRTPLIVSDVRNLDILDAGLKQFCIDQQIISFINLPVIKNGILTGRFVLTIAAPRVWTEVEIELAGEVAERTWAAVERANVEEALRESEGRFRSIANLMPDLLWESEPNGLTNWYNQRWLEYTGQSFEQAINWGWTEAIHPDDREASAKRYAEAVETGKPLQQEHRIQHYDGQYRWFAVSALPLKDEDGRVVKMYGSATDIHDRRQADEALRESELKLRTLIQNLPGAAVFIVDKDLRYLVAEGEALLQAGFKSTDIVGKTIAEAIPEDAAEREKYYRKALAGEAFNIEHQEHNHTYISRGTPLRNAAGEVYAVLAISYDITDRQKAEEALRLSEERYRTVIESAEMGAWDWNITEDKTIWNREHYTMLGADMDHQPMDSDYFLQFLHPDDAERVKNTLFEAVNTQGTYHAEFRIIRGDTGDVRWMDGFGRVAAVKDSEATRMVGVMSDITDRKKLEEQREEFIGVASHELKTPVTSIKAYAQILLEMLDKTADTQSTTLLRKLDLQLDRLTKLIQDLLDTTKISEGQLPLHKETFDIETLITENIEAWQRLTSRHRLIWKPESNCPLYADKERIGQVLTNFVSNAIKYSPNGGDITIACLQKGEAIEFSVQDHGIGIPEEVQRRVFDRFFRVKDARLQTFPGLGLGLYISAGIIQRHNGTIRVESKPEVGSTFIFTLPAPSEK